MNGQLYPGEVAKLRIKTNGNAICAVSATDKASSFVSGNKMLNVHSLLQPFLQERAAKSSYVPQCVSGGKSRSNFENLEAAFDLRRRRSLGKIEEFDSFDAFSVS